MKDRVKILSVKLSGDTGSTPKELESLEADANYFFEHKEGTLKKVDLGVLTSYETYATLVILYEENDATPPSDSAVGYAEYGLIDA